MTNQYDRNFAAVYNSMNDIEKYIKEVKYIKNFLDDHGLILDVGCGTGIHSFLLNKMGYNCVGIDTSKDMIEVANKNKNNNLVFKTTTIEDFVHNEKFDACISIFNVINHIFYLDQLEIFLKKIYENLRIGGVFLFDCFNNIAMNLEKPKEKYENGLKTYSKYTPQTGILEIKYTGKHSLNLKHRIWDISILSEILKKIGFEINVYKRNTLDKLKDNDYKVTFVCRRIK